MLKNLTIYRVLASPSKLFAYMHLKKERAERFAMLCRVTRLESAWDLRDKIKKIDDQIEAL